MTKEEADLAQRYNAPCLIDREGYGSQQYYIKELIRWRDPLLNNEFKYSAVMWNRQLPRHGVVTVNIHSIKLVPGFDKFIENKLKERSERRNFEELKSKLKN